MSGDWILCSEKLPKSGTAALVVGEITGQFRKQAFMVIADYWECKDLRSCDDETGWYVDESGEMVEPTHWMPLPKPPSIS